MKKKLINPGTNKVSGFLNSLKFMIKGCPCDNFFNTGKIFLEKNF